MTDVTIEVLQKKLIKIKIKFTLKNIKVSPYALKLFLRPQQIGLLV